MQIEVLLEALRDLAQQCAGQAGLPRGGGTSAGSPWRRETWLSDLMHRPSASQATTWTGRGLVPEGLV